MSAGSPLKWARWRRSTPFAASSIELRFAQPRVVAAPRNLTLEAPARDRPPGAHGARGPHRRARPAMRLPPRRGPATTASRRSPSISGCCGGRPRRVAARRSVGLLLGQRGRARRRARLPRRPQRLDGPPHVADHCDEPNAGDSASAASPSSRSTSTQSFHSPSSRPWRRCTPTSTKPAARWTARLAALVVKIRLVSLYRPRRSASRPAPRAGAGRGPRRARRRRRRRRARRRPRRRSGRSTGSRARSRRRGRRRPRRRGSGSPGSNHAAISPGARGRVSNVAWRSAMPVL